MSEIVAELFGNSTTCGDPNWSAILRRQHCPYLDKKCIKIRKSQPEISIGTCAVNYGKKEEQQIVICPHRLLERRQIFTDALHLLTLHEPGNELHVISEVSIPGGSIDYFLVSAHRGKAVDFVGVELQTLDTTGTVWPARERFLSAKGLKRDKSALKSKKSFGMNWKMTAKTTLVQLHHKIETFESISKHLVLVVQDCLLEYMSREFSFDHFYDARIGDSMHFHAYKLEHGADGSHKLQFASRKSTDAAGVAAALGLKTAARVELSEILANIQKKLSKETLWTPV